MNAALSTMTEREELAGAAARGELRLHYQPIVELPGGELAGYEALLRWQHPVRGMVPPDAFIPLAEDSGAIVGIGEWVIEEACAQAAAWQQHIAVNVASQQLTPGFADMVLENVKRRDIPASRIVIEVTESAAIESDPKIAELEALAGRGHKIAIDDFGTGYASLEMLQRLPAHILKIDRAFVEVLDGTPYHAAIAECVIRMARQRGLTTIAEGVETREQAEELTALGCAHAQGWYFGRPQPPA